MSLVPLMGMGLPGSSYHCADGVRTGYASYLQPRKKNQDYGRSSNEKASFLTNLYSFLKGVDSTVVSQEPSVSAWNKCKEIDYRS